MSNRNYVKGRAFEYKTAKTLRDVYGCEVMRTAGSHGLFDLISITPQGIVEFIQCKVVKTHAEAERLITKFQDQPPLGYRRLAAYHQQLEVKVQEDRSTRSVMI